MTISARIEARLNEIQVGNLERKRVLERARSLSEECGCKASLVASLATAFVLFGRQQTGVDHALVSWGGLGWTLGAAVAGNSSGLLTRGCGCALSSDDWPVFRNASAPSRRPSDGNLLSSSA